MLRKQEAVNATEQPNLWSTLLKESSKRFKAPEATCVFLGNANIGKRTLMGKIGECPGFDLESSRVIKDIVSYTYMDVDEGLLDSDSLSRINLWSVSDKNFEDCIDKVIKSRKLERLLFMVGVDVSKPDGCIDCLKKLLRMVRSFALQHNETYSGDESRTNWADLGLSVIIVACKSDLVKADDAVSLKRAKAIQGQLRAIALHIGAAVVFVSAATDANNSRLKRYIINRLYPESVSDERGIEDGVSTAFIPSGADSAELILIATGIAIDSGEGLLATQLDSPLNADEEGGSVTTSSIPLLSSLDLEDEEDWLKGLQDFISDVTSSGATSSLQSLSGTSSLAVNTENGEPAAVKSSTRRTFRAPGAAQGKQDVDDFFQKLLIGGGPAAAKK